METKIYAAYGSNMNIKQMAGRCPAATVVGTGMLMGHRLTFRQGVANIEPARGRRVPIVLWEITPDCEVALDRYEGYPRLYTKKEITITLEDGTKTKAMAYIMTKQHWAHPGAPNGYYLKTIQDGYRDNGLPSKFLRDAVASATNTKPSGNRGRRSHGASCQGTVHDGRMTEMGRLLIRYALYQRYKDLHGEKYSLSLGEVQYKKRIYINTAYFRIG